MSRVILFLLLCLPVYAENSTNPNRDNVIQVNNFDVMFTVSAARDIGPVTRMDGSGLIISLEMYSLDREKLPENITLQGAWAQFNSEIWNMEMSRDISVSRYFDGTGFLYKFRQGPIWPVGSMIDVNFKLIIDEVSYTIEQRNVRILKNS